MRRSPWLCIAALFVCLLSSPATANAELVRAGVYLNEPFVLERADGTFGGMAIDLWREIGEALGLETAYVRYPTPEALVQAAEAGDADVILTNLSMTYERSRRVRFTYPWFDSGLRIMVNDDFQASVWGEMERSGHLRTYLLLFFGVLFATVLLTVIRRRKEADFPRRWTEGLALCFHELIVAFKAGNARSCLDWCGWPGLVLSALWVLCRVGIIAYITSTAASTITVATLAADIDTIDDLSGEIIGVSRGSVSEEYLQKLGFETSAYDGIEEAAAALGEGEIRAVVASAPVLEYWVKQHPEGDTAVVGAPFHPDKFAFATNRRQGDLADRISLELLRLREAGRIGELREKYFGNDAM